ncbi:MAG: DUF1810 domain-containing protein [Lachnospiraceae bacterium]|nr:DUF1810 domain-containing protein [Lachnospiraceae bacterium]
MMYNIERFHDVHRIYFEDALKEIQSGRKQSHWMWYIFPQLKTLGQSYKAIYFGMENAEEARLFYNDNYLGGNLRKICQALLECESNDAFEVMGYPDNLKLYSSMTLFYLATGDKLFSDVLQKFYDGKQDKATIKFLTK